jgi:hypothetical protein
VTSLPANDSATGPLVFLTTDSNLYRWNGTAWTRSVNGADITDYTVIGSKIAIADTTNLIPNPFFIDGNGGNSIDGWAPAVGGGLTCNVGTPWPTFQGYGVQMCRDVYTAGPGPSAAGNLFPVVPGETYYVDAYDTYNVSGYNFSGGMHFTDASLTTHTWMGAWLGPNGTNGPRSGQVTVPAGYYWANFWSNIDGPGGVVYTGGAFAYIVGPRLRKAASAELLVDGSITAANMTANSIVAGTLAVGAVNASAIIVNNIIVTGHLVANSVTNSAATQLNSGNNVSIGLSTASGAVIVAAGGQIIGGTPGSVSLQNLTTGQVFAAYSIPSNGSFSLLGYDTAAGTGTNTYQVACSGFMNVTLYALEVLR